MKILVVLAAVLAVAASFNVREKRGIIGSTVLAGPSGTIVTSPGLVSAHGLLGVRSILAPGLLGPGIIAAPGITAGTIVAPGTTLIGPNTNGAPGAVITNGLLGPQILV